MTSGANFDDDAQTALQSSAERDGYNRTGQLGQQCDKSAQHQYAPFRPSNEIRHFTHTIVVLGAGVLAMPLALSRMGILVGILVIMWSALAAGFGLYLQTRCARYLERGSSSYFALSQITYPNVAVVFDAAIVVKCFGVGVSYLIVIGDLMPGVVRGFSENAWGFTTLLERRFWITAVMFVSFLEVSWAGEKAN